MVSLEGTVDMTGPITACIAHNDWELYLDEASQSPIKKYPQCLAQVLAYSRCSIKCSYVNKRILYFFLELVLGGVK